MSMRFKQPVPCLRKQPEGRESGRKAETLIFHVEDTGCGIRKEDLDTIFEDFRQVDSKRNRSAEGTGLGLAIVTSKPGDPVLYVAVNRR